LGEGRGRFRSGIGDRPAGGRCPTAVSLGTLAGTFLPDGLQAVFPVFGALHSPAANQGQISFVNFSLLEGFLDLAGDFRRGSEEDDTGGGAIKAVKEEPALIPQKVGFPLFIVGKLEKGTRNIRLLIGMT